MSKITTTVMNVPPSKSAIKKTLMTSISFIYIILS